MNPGGIYAFLLLFLLSWPQMVLGKGVKLYNSKTEPPPKGKSGTYHDKANKVLHVYYGDDHLEHHMVHLQENYQQHPHNDRLYDVGPKRSTKNRKKAMEDSEMGLLASHARDEKPPNIVVHDGKSVTVKHVPKKESDIEGGMLSGVATKARKNKSQIRFHAHPSEGRTPPAGSSAPVAGTSASAAAMCAREVDELYRRALAEGDDEQLESLEYLSRRGLCTAMLPRLKLPRLKSAPKKAGIWSGVTASTRSHHPASHPASHPVSRSGPRPISRHPASRPAFRRPPAHSAAHPADRHPASRPASRRPAANSAAHPAARRPAANSAHPADRRPASRRPAANSAPHPVARRPASHSAGWSAPRPASRRPAANSAAHPAARRPASHPASPPAARHPAALPATRRPAYHPVSRRPTAHSAALPAARHPAAIPVAPRPAAIPVAHRPSAPPAAPPPANKPAPKPSHPFKPAPMW